MSMSGSRSCIAVFMALVTFCETHSASAASSGVTAVLSNSEAAVGATVQLQIRVTGARSADAPENIAVNGLEIHRTGTSQHFEMNNFNVTSSVIYDYTIMPLEAGTFIIPPETINGRSYDVVTFKTAIAAARAGKFEIGPIKAKAQVLTARRPNTPRSRSPFDLFNLDDPFSDPFFSEPFSQFGERREVEINSEPVAFEVKPLPQNAPPSFSGAIGNFTMTTDAKPKSVQVGDPITVTSTISGRGNFDRVNAPAVEDDRGWHKYPPSSKFKNDEEVGISGPKTFERVLSPNEKKPTIPILAFSYFDPAKEQYVTLRGDPIAINVQGGAIPAPAPVASQPAASTMPAAASAAAAKQDILYQLNERGRMQSFAPLYARPIFWTPQLIPLLALLGFAGWKIRQARIDNRAARRIAALQHEAAELLRKLRRNDVSPREYYAEASRVVRVKAALARNVHPNTVDAETAANPYRLNSDSRERLRRLLDQG